jgi:predicted secreted acid phosphatase
LQFQQRLGLRTDCAWELSASAEAIKPTVELVEQAKKESVTVFFISGRHEGTEERAATEKNLHEAGYDAWQQLYLRTNDFGGPSVAPFKIWARHDIEVRGYVIIANVGDQWSDLEGGYAERRFKVPNPFYYIP